MITKNLVQMRFNRVLLALATEAARQLHLSRTRYVEKATRAELFKDENAGFIHFSKKEISEKEKYDDGRL